MLHLKIIIYDYLKNENLTKQTRGVIFVHHKNIA